MLVRRLRVEEGFLDGIDVEFAPGLNVIIGERGTGKTSIIELLRFCLGAPSLTERGRAASAQAIGVLGSGQARVEFADGNQQYVSLRAASDRQPRTTPALAVPPQLTILGQNEIESIGLEPASRLQLIDRFRTQQHRSMSAQLERARADQRSLTSEIASVSREIADLDEQIASLGGVTQELEKAVEQEQQLLRSVAASAEQRQRLEVQGERLTLLSLRAGIYSRSHDQLASFLSRLNGLIRQEVRFEAWPSEAGSEDLVAPIRRDVAQVHQGLQGLVQRLVNAQAALERLQGENESARIEAEEQARILRQELNQLQQGAGASSRLVSTLRERAGQLTSLRAIKDDRTGHLEQLIQTRLRITDEIDAVQEETFRERQLIASRLNETLGPRIHVAIQKGAQDSTYIASITAGLRGSGLQYNALAPVLASRLSPHELVTAVEKHNFDSIASLCGISVDRAQKAVSSLTDFGLDQILAATVEDGVKISLLDGTEYKSTDGGVSTGQRCTAILPIIMSLDDGLLVIDQPEDNLDNAFISDTLVRALREPRKERQLILVTHNANIPVLGDADRVIVLASDGSRGYIKHRGPLDDLDSVRAITGLMEGGWDAFKQRSDFYQRFAQLDGFV